MILRTKCKYWLAVLVFLSYLGVLAGCNPEKNISTTDEAVKKFECILKPFVGINEIVLGETTFKEIEESLGKGLRSTKRHKMLTVGNILPLYEHFLTYPDLGIQFKTTSEYKRSGLLKVAWILRLSAPCECKTKEGMGIGSSYQTIHMILGAPIYYGHVKDGDNTFTEASFIQKKHWFNAEHGGKLTLIDFSIEKITMFIDTN